MQMDHCSIPYGDCEIHRSRLATVSAEELEFGNLSGDRRVANHSLPVSKKEEWKGRTRRIPIEHRHRWRVDIDWDEQNFLNGGPCRQSEVDRRVR